MTGDPISQAVRRVVVRKREHYLSVAVERGIITSAQAEGLLLLFLEQLDAIVREDERYEQEGDQ